MSYEEILMEKDGGIATITLNRPDRLNALTHKMRGELREALQEADADESIRVVIITGAGSGFCAGAELGAGGAQPADEPKRALLMQPVTSERIVEAIRNLGKPTICALNGVAAGAGAGIAVSCDITIASDKARFRIADTRFGNAPGVGMSFNLPRRIGMHRAMELIYTNKVIDAREMDRIGLVNIVVPHDELMKAAKEMAQNMFDTPPLGLASAKRSIQNSVVTPSAEAQFIFDRGVNATLGQTEDAKEARASLGEKRKPLYKWR